GSCRPAASVAKRSSGARAGACPWGRPGCLPQARAGRGFLAAFRDMGGPIDHLQIGYSPIDQQRRPGCHGALAAPDLEQGYAMIDLRIPSEPCAADRAAVTLQTPQMPHVIAGRRPQLPGLDAAGMPGRISVRMSVVPQIAMPSEPEHRLSAHAAIS